MAEEKKEIEKKKVIKAKEKVVKKKKDSNAVGDLKVKETIKKKKDSDTVDLEAKENNQSEKILKEAEKKDFYFEAVGRRKTSTSRVRLYAKGKKEIIVNDKPYESYFSTKELQKVFISPLTKMGCDDKFRVSVVVKGGGINSQAEASRHGISRALVVFNPEFKKRLRRAGYLTRDPRQRERKKFGLKRARRAPQWKKR